MRQQFDIKKIDLDCLLFFWKSRRIDRPTERPFRDGTDNKIPMFSICDWWRHSIDPKKNSASQSKQKAKRQTRKKKQTNEDEDNERRLERPRTRATLGFLEDVATGSPRNAFVQLRYPTSIRPIPIRKLVGVFQNPLADSAKCERRKRKRVSFFSF